MNALNAVNGKKTWIGLAMFAAGHLAKAAATVVPEYAPLLNVVGDYLVNAGVALAGIGAAHKLVKGE